MQENTFSAYVRLTKVGTPTPTNTVNGVQEPLFFVKATGVAVCGVIRNPNSQRMEPERREVDLTFVGVTNKQAELITEQSEHYINGASAISADSSVNYGARNYPDLGKDVDNNGNLSAHEIINTITTALLLANPDAAPDQLRKQIERLVPISRRQTFVRIQSGQWRLTASAKQITNAQQVDEFSYTS